MASQLWKPEGMVQRPPVKGAECICGSDVDIRLPGANCVESCAA